jgi:hypothetical protein
MAALVKTHAAPLLQGDATAYQSLREQQSHDAAEYTKEVHLRAVRRQAEAAWQDKDCGTLLSLYSGIQGDPIPSEFMRLQYAEKQQPRFIVATRKANRGGANLAAVTAAGRPLGDGLLASAASIRHPLRFRGQTDRLSDFRQSGNSVHETLSTKLCGSRRSIGNSVEKAKPKRLRFLGSRTTVRRTPKAISLSGARPSFNGCGRRSTPSRRSSVSICMNRSTLSETG